jgi:hypothetical protein
VQSKWQPARPIGTGFLHISMDWRGRPLVSYEVIVDLIGAATTPTGLRSAPSLT